MTGLDQMPIHTYFRGTVMAGNPLYQRTGNDCHCRKNASLAPYNNHKYYNVFTWKLEFFGIFYYLVFEVHMILRREYDR